MRRIVFPRMLITVVGALLLVSHASAARVDGDEGPHVLGHGVGLFTAGEVIAEENFETLENWVVQKEDRSGAALAKIGVKDRKLDCFVP